MKNYYISNKPALDVWRQERMKMGHSLVGIKGPHPDDAEFENKDMRGLPINVAWKDFETGEIFSIEWSKKYEH